MLLGTSMVMTLMSVLMAILSALYRDGSNAAAGKGMAAIIFLFLATYSFIDVRLSGGDPKLYTSCSRSNGVWVCEPTYTTPIAIGDIMQSIRRGMLLSDPSSLSLGSWSLRRLINYLMRISMKTMSSMDGVMMCKPNVDAMRENHKIRAGPRIGMMDLAGIPADSIVRVS
jgi:hypothetical protein